LQHGDYVVSGVLPKEYAGVRGDELKEFIGEIAAQGQENQDDAGDEMDVDYESDGEPSGGGDTGEGQEEIRQKSQKRKSWTPWSERFKVVALDGR
jgi:hypothetical protein